MPFQKWLFLNERLSKQAIPAGKIMDYVADYLILCLARTPQGHFITLAQTKRELRNQRQRSSMGEANEEATRLVS